MRLAVIVLAALTLVPAAMGQNNNPEIGAFTPSQSSIDLIADAGGALQLSLMATDNDQGDRVVAVELVLRSGSHVQIVNPLPSASTTGLWEVSIPVNDVPSDPTKPVLLVGSWDVTIKAWDRFGGFASRVESSAYTVTAADASSHPLEFGVFDAAKTGTTYDRMDLGPSSTLRFQVSIPGAQHMVRSVTYKVSASAPDIRLAAPYVVAPELLGPGEKTIHATLLDRAGRTASLALPIYVDLNAPTIAAEVPDITYQGVPFDVEVAVADASSWTAYITVDEVQKALEGTGGGTVTGSFTRSELGLGNVLVVVVDRLGNSNDLLVNVTTHEAITDTTGALAISPKYPLPGQAINFTMTLEQKTGVTELPVSGRLFVTGRGVLAMPTANLTIGAESTHSFQASFLPGAYEANFTVSAGELVNETNDSDQTVLKSFEVFLGKVVVEATGTEYYIRVDSFGLPKEAVSTTGASYPLKLDQSSGRDLYVFTAGENEYAWNANERITTIQVGSEPGEDSPGIGFVAVIALLGAVAFLRRRK